MSKRIKNIVIVGGGSAGWITASLLAARHRVGQPHGSEKGLSITLIESPDIPSIGVGEGTWPTMRGTLQRIGLCEKDFLVECEASFKQGSRFDGWLTGEPEDSYLHPFDIALTASSNDIYALWKETKSSQSFDQSVSSQAEVCSANLAPKQVGMPDYAYALNYAYHLDATKLGKILTDHATKYLGVKHIQDHVSDVVGAQGEDIQAVVTRHHGEIEGDLFVDCTGLASILLGGHYGIELEDKSSVLFNNKAITTHVPLAHDQPIASQTISTAHDNGWVWDIALPTRRGLGCVYSSKHCNSNEALSVLKAYIKSTSQYVDVEDLVFRDLSFPTGYRKEFWHKNCLAIGLSAGFIEPLEASALVLVELSVGFLSENFPTNRSIMTILSKRFNQTFTYRWERIVDFLKLHYVLSQRNSKYWQDQRSEETIPERLRELLTLWKQQAPGQSDFNHSDEIFPAASYQYVLYGMGFETELDSTLKLSNKNEAVKQMQLVERNVRKYIAGLPSNRAYLNGLVNG